MLITAINNIDLQNGAIHLATDWQVSDDRRFSNILIESIQDTVNLRYKIDNDVLQTEVTYYARARALLSTGYTVWSNLDVFVIDNTIDIARSEEIPTVISPPLLSIDCDPKNCKPTLFKVMARGFSTQSNALHKSTSWVVLDSNQNVLFSSIQDEVNLYDFIFTPDDIVMEDNKIYHIKVMYHSFTGDSSSLSTLTIHVNNNDKGKVVIGDLYNIDSNINNVLRAYNVPDLNIISWEITGYNNRISYPIFAIDYNIITYPTDIYACAIPSNTLDPTSSYILSVGLITDASTTMHHTLIKTIDTIVREEN